MSVIKYGSDIPTFVRRLRDDLGLTQNEMAQRIGVHKQYISNVERGVHHNPVGFCALLFGICPRDRQEYLADLIGEAGADRALARLRLKAKKKIVRAPRK